MIGEGIPEDPYWSCGKETACSEPFQKALESLERIKKEPAFAAPSGLSRLTEEERNELLSCMDRAEELLKKVCNPLEKRERAEKIRERMNMQAEMHCQTQVFSYTIGKSKGEAYAELFR